MTVHSEGLKTGIASGSITKYRMINPASGGGNQVEQADDGDQVIGVAQHDADDGDHVTYKPLCFPGTTKLEVDGSSNTINEGDGLDSDADGKGVQQVTTGDIAHYIALETSDADGTIIEAMPCKHQVE